MHLQHIHLPSLTPYPLASAIQNVLIQRHLDFHHPPPPPPPPSSDPRQKTSPSTHLPPPTPPRPPPSPCILTFTTPPTYTTGRRQRLTASQIATLRDPTAHHPFTAAYHPSQRGGLLTYHGPGQLTAYAVLHLRSHALTARTYIRLLERSLVGALARHGVRGFTRDEYPGVWVGERRKLASVGVHVRRGVTGFGVGLNVGTPREWWERGAACGIEGVEMVALRDLEVEAEVRGMARVQVGEGEDGVRDVGGVLAQELALRLEAVEGGKVLDVPAEEVSALLEEARMMMMKASDGDGEGKGESGAG